TLAGVIALPLDPDSVHAIAGADLEHHVHAVGDLSEDRVSAVEVRGRAEADEKLRAAGVLAGVGHRQRPRDVLVGVLLALALDLVAGAAGAAAEGTAALNHEAGLVAVEAEPIVKRLALLLL